MSQIVQFLGSYGGPLLFVVGFAEQSGLPFPAAPFLLVAGALAASGEFGLISTIAWAAAGCVAADAIWFHVGHRTSSRVFRVFPHLHAVRSRLQHAPLGASVRHGVRMLTAAKFLPFGTVVPLHAGALAVGSLRFLLLDALASVFYAAAYAFVGFAFHDQLERVIEFFRQLGALSLPLIVILVGTYVVHWFRKHRPSRTVSASPGFRNRESS